MKRVFILSILILFISLCTGSILAGTTKLLSYNIKGHSMTSSRLADIATIINTQNPDIVALQEVDNRSLGIFNHDYLSELAESTGMHSQFFALVGTYYGIGILSKTEPISVKTQSFAPSDTSKDKESRGFLIAEFDNFYFLCTHYSLNADDRDTATEWAIRFARQSDKTVFIAGDFNAQPTYRAMVTFKEYGFSILNNTALYTYPAKDPTSCIDMIISYRPDDSLKYTTTETGVVTEEPGLTLSDVSDHLPVFVTIEAEGSAVYDATSLQEINLIKSADGFSLSNLKTTSQVDIYDISGKLIKTQNVDNATNIVLPEGSRNGLYVIRVSNAYQNSSFKYLY